MPACPRSHERSQHDQRQTVLIWGLLIIGIILIGWALINAGVLGGR